MTEDWKLSLIWISTTPVSARAPGQYSEEESKRLRKQSLPAGLQDNHSIFHL